ncbi:sodium channel protein Nach isoform X2 [Episyrphus balteatus]|uniref:sodium channel protein Nach isoform X2 n=1 Tax=Episyrphus balteatus TaxID=286459 RepID=UPI002485230D|nr:sodium channel protein Nach isoform X2 [Episyrphus balteatus]
MFNNNRFPIPTPLPNYDYDGDYERNSPPPPNYYHQRQRYTRRHERLSNQQQRHHQHHNYFDRMDNNHNQNHSKQTQLTIGDPNTARSEYEYDGGHWYGNNYPPQQRPPIMLQQLPPSSVLMGDPDGLLGGGVRGGQGDIGKTVAITKPSIKGSKRNYRTKAKAFIIEFLQEASLHGFIYLSKVGLHFVERILWLVFICIAFFGVISLSHRTWERFQTSPIVMSMDRNKLVWNTSFPSLTVCPHKRLDDNKIDEYLDDKYLDTLFKLKWNFEPELSSGTTVKMNIYQTITELGICHSVNTLVARYNSYEYWTSNDWGLLDHDERVTVHPLDGEIYAQIINLSTAYDVYFHSAGDIPNISKQKYTFPESDYTTVELIALETFTTPRAKELKVNQRKCRFSNEADEMMTVPIYSYGLCLTECRMKLAWRACKCVPHFYRRRVKGGRIFPVCDFMGLSCLARIKKEIISLKSDILNIDCKCFANCDDSNFFVQSNRSRVWFLGANLQWGIIDYPKMQLRRDVLFSFADVLVYIGGLAGFFLGCSLLTLTEIIYFFTARFFRRLFL